MVWHWGPSLLRKTLHNQDIFPDFYLLHVGMGPACSVSLPILPVLMWLFYNSLVVELLFSQISWGSE